MTPRSMTDGPLGDGPRSETAAPLMALAQRVIRSDTGAYERALLRYVSHDQGLVAHDGIRRRYLETLRRLALRLDAGPVVLAGEALDATTRDALRTALARLLGDPPADEGRFRELGLLPELPQLLAQELHLYRDDYLAFVAALPRAGRYRPRYMNLGPSGRCNLRCPSCILWGALFAGGDGVGVTEEAVLAHLSEAEERGDPSGISLCIGEPTAHLPLLDGVLDRVRVSSRLQLRSFVTNGRFARHPEGARKVWERVLTHLGAEKAARCVFALSSNVELDGQGVHPEHTVNALEAFGEVMPNAEVFVQILRDAGYPARRQELLDRLVARELLTPEGISSADGSEEPGYPLATGTRLRFSAMARMPAIGSATGETTYDPGVAYLDPTQEGPFPGLFMGTSDEPGEETDDAPAERIALGPDGLFYVDYHFMVRRARPLGRSLDEAVESFERDPLLTRLQRRGGLNDVLDAYERLDAADRPYPNLREMIGRYATVSMAAANVIFADDPLALRLARQLVVSGSA